MTEVTTRPANPPAGTAFTEGFVEADGFRIRYQQAGTGQPLICFHGAGGPRLSYAHDILCKSFRVIAFEAPGFGKSAPNDRSATIQDLAETMSQAIANLGIERFNLMGTSFGGRLAVFVALAHPDRIERLILMSPAALRPGPDETTNPSTRPPDPSEADLLVAHPDRYPPREPLGPGVSERQSALVQRLAGPPRAEIEQAMTGLDIPTLILFGTEDRVMPPALGRVYRAKLPRGHLVFVYDAGHAMDIDRPDAVASVVSEFIEHGEGFIVKRESSLIHP